MGAQNHSLRQTEGLDKTVLDFSNRSFKEGIKEVGGEEGGKEGGRREGLCSSLTSKRNGNPGESFLL